MKISGTCNTQRTLNESFLAGVMQIISNLYVYLNEGEKVRECYGYLKLMTIVFVKHVSLKQFYWSHLLEQRMTHNYPKKVKHDIVKSAVTHNESKRFLKVYNGPLLPTAIQKELQRFTTAQETFKNNPKWPATTQNIQQHPSPSMRAAVDCFLK